LCPSAHPHHLTFNSMTDEELIALNEEIAGMARAGLPLDQGLAAMGREMGRGNLQRITLALAADLRAGHPLAEALRRQENRVPPFYASLVAAGVRSGRIGEVLGTLTVYARTLANLRATVREALYYPATVMLFSLFLFGLLGFGILPQFDEIFQEFGMTLPTVTVLILGIFRNPWPYLVGPLLFLAAVVGVAAWQVRRAEQASPAWARAIYSVPILGTLLHSARLAAFTDLLAILVDHQLPLPEAFVLAGAASTDPVMAHAARDVEESLREGVPLGEALRGRGLVPEWVAWMAGLGEKRGTLGASLRQIASLYRHEAEMRAALLRNVLPPFLIIVTAGMFVTVFACTVMMPMYKLLEGLSK
jgi:type II secretory pathway component PulF